MQIWHFFFFLFFWPRLNISNSCPYSVIKWYSNVDKRKSNTIKGGKGWRKGNICQSLLVRESDARCQAFKFLVSNRLLCGPEKWRTNCWSVSNCIWQKQQLNAAAVSWSAALVPGEITFLCTEHKCLSRCAFCLNMATHSLHANGFSPVCTRKCVFRFQLMPNCLPQYVHLYSRPAPPPPPTDNFSSVSDDDAVAVDEFWWCCWCWSVNSVAIGSTGFTSEKKI